MSRQLRKIQAFPEMPDFCKCLQHIYLPIRSPQRGAVLGAAVDVIGVSLTWTLAN